MKVWRQRERRVEELRVAAYDHLGSDDCVSATRDGRVVVNRVCLELRDLLSFLEAVKVAPDDVTIESANMDETLVIWHE